MFNNDSYNFLFSILISNTFPRNFEIHTLYFESSVIIESIELTFF